MDSHPLTRQIEIVHLSDIHFGKHHRFQPELTPKADRPHDPGFPSLADKLISDLKETSNCPVAICATGDFAEIADVTEFSEAEAFFKKLLASKILGKSLSPQDVFLVPGNHDVSFDSSDVGIRFQQYTDFHNRFYNETVRRENPLDFCRVYDRVDTHGAIVACLNSSIHVRKNAPDEDRGNLDSQQLACLEEELEKIEKKRLQSAVKIALVHHHPVLIPSLAEPKRGYDAIHNSGRLLLILKKFGFHAVLHGHKHNPHTFTDDIRAAAIDTEGSPIFFSCGGSVGSKELPGGPGMTNCYNRIIIKWHPDGHQFRVRCTTRGLSMYNADHTERLPTHWDWKTMAVCDRHFIGDGNRVLLPQTASRKFDKVGDKQRQELRIQKYQQTRGYLPIVEVRPSLIPTQAYEAVVWIAEHSPTGERRKPEDVAKKVIWSAGPLFNIKEVSAEESPKFSTAFNYWGPMLVQANIIFADGGEAFTHVYAHLPVSEIVSD